MKVRINEIDYNNAEWIVDTNMGIGRLLFASDESIVAIITNLGEHNDIDVYDEEDTLLSRWYNSGVISVNALTDSEGRKIEVLFKVSVLNENAETVLQNGIDESVDGIMELAELYSDLDTEHAETRRRIELYADSVQQISQDFDTKQKSNNEKFAEKNAQISELVNAINALRDDLTAVQAAIQDIPADILQRFAAIDSRYNALADRVAALENK